MTLRIIPKVSRQAGIIMLGLIFGILKLFKAIIANLNNFGHDRKMNKK